MAVTVVLPLHSIVTLPATVTIASRLQQTTTATNFRLPL